LDIKGETMRTLGTLLTLGIFAAAVGCGSSDSKKPDSGVSPGVDGAGIDAPATGGIDAPATGGIDAPVGGVDGPAGLIDSSGGGTTCNLPACAASLLTTCQPAGACVARSVDAGIGAPKASCFANGVKLVTATDLTTFSTTYTYKNGNATCYSVAVTLASPVSFTFKDATGVAIGSGSYDLTTGTVTFACTNSSPVVLNAACNVASLISVSAGSCTDGACDP
jgi:hypothetical protein